MELIFRPLPANEMERPPTQRDQFDNDDVELVDALVREAIQNSLDANDRGQSETVQVRFDVLSFDSAERPKVLDLLRTEQLNRHLVATNLPEIDGGDDLLALTVEDFGTKGLTGKWNEWDEMPFCDFWRRMGKSHKSGQSLGRWGLGKLVFSSSSKARVFFGLSIRRNDAEELLMGQAVLTHHTIDGARLDSHAFYAVRGKDDFQLPERTPEVIDGFKKLFRLRRSDEPGLSIVVPCLRNSISLERIAKGVVRNYFFPILFGHLEVHVGNLVINATSFAEVAEKKDPEYFLGGNLAAFIQEMKATRQPHFEPPLTLPQDWTKKELELVLADQLDSMREQFNAGKLVMVRAPILMKKKNGEELPSFVDAFLKRAPTDHQSLFVRHAIVLNAEHKYFKASKTFGALIADDQAVSEFLGDAENPAHTGWSASAEKVASKWRSAPERLKEIRQLLKRLHNGLVSALETVEKDALISIFSLPTDDGSKGASPRGDNARPPNVPPLEPHKRAYRLTKLADGFMVQQGTVTEDDLPIVIRVQVAYDVLRGNPFKKHNAVDFDFTKRSILVASDGADITTPAANTLIIEAKRAEFVVNVSGFDLNRDLIIDAEKLS